MEAGDKITRYGKRYEAFSFNQEINASKKTGKTDPCTMCALDPITCDNEGIINCITGTEFLYFKQI